jgi:hypothetical protein
LRNINSLDLELIYETEDLMTSQILILIKIHLCQAQDLKKSLHWKRSNLKIFLLNMLNQCWIGMVNQTTMPTNIDISRIRPRLFIDQNVITMSTIGSEWLLL